MIDFTGGYHAEILWLSLCESCGKPLTLQDDIVVCPDCGAPYHRHLLREDGSVHPRPCPWRRLSMEVSLSGCAACAPVPPAGSAPCAARMSAAAAALPCPLRAQNSPTTVLPPAPSGHQDFVQQDAAGTKCTAILEKVVDPVHRNVRAAFGKDELIDGVPYQPPSALR